MKKSPFVCSNGSLPEQQSVVTGKEKVLLSSCSPRPLFMCPASDVSPQALCALRKSTGLCMACQGWPMLKHQEFTWACARPSQGLQSCSH